MKRIDFEAHFITLSYLDTLYKNKGFPRIVEDPDTGDSLLWSTDDVWNPVVEALLRSF